GLTNDCTSNKPERLTNDDSILGFRCSIIDDQFAIAHHILHGLDDRIAATRDTVRIIEAISSWCLTATKIDSASGAGILFVAVVSRQAFTAAVSNALALLVDPFALGKNS